MQCENTCAFPNDSVCDDGGPGAETNVCKSGTDCDDCSVRFYRPPSPPPSPPPPPSSSSSGAVIGILEFFGILALLAAGSACVIFFACCRERAQRRQCRECCVRRLKTPVVKAKAVKAPVEMTAEAAQEAL